MNILALFFCVVNVLGNLQHPLHFVEPLFGLLTTLNIPSKLQFIVCWDDGNYRRDWSIEIIPIFIAVTRYKFINLLRKFSNNNLAFSNLLYNPFPSIEDEYHYVFLMDLHCSETFDLVKQVL